MNNTCRDARRSCLLLAVALVVACSRGKKQSAPLVSAHAATQVGPEPAPAPKSSAASLAHDAPPPEELPTVVVALSAQKLASHVTYAELYQSGSCEFRAHALQGAVLLTRCNTITRREGDQQMPIELGMSNDAEIEDLHLLQGTWPHGLSGIAELNERFRGERGDYHQRSECMVTGNSTGLHCSRYGALPVAWSKGRTLTLASGQFELLVGNRDLPMPKLAHGSSSECPDRFRLTAIGALPDGRLIAAGPSCEHQGRLEVEAWNGDGGDGTVEQLPVSNELSEPIGLRVLLGNRGIAYVLARSKAAAALYRAEAGGGYRKVPLPALPELWPAIVRADGTFWFVSEADRPNAYRFADGTWTQLDLPDETAIRHALGEPAQPESLRLKVTSIGVQKGKTFIGSTIVQGQDRNVGGALLELGAASPTTRDGGGPSP
jgi:hypothetical protein